MGLCLEYVRRNARALAALKTAQSINAGEAVIARNSIRKARRGAGFASLGRWPNHVDLAAVPQGHRVIAFGILRGQDAAAKSEAIQLIGRPPSARHRRMLMNEKSVKMFPGSDGTKRGHSVGGRANGNPCERTLCDPDKI